VDVRAPSPPSLLRQNHPAGRIHRHIDPVSQFLRMDLEMPGAVLRIGRIARSSDPCTLAEIGGHLHLRERVAIAEIHLGWQERTLDDAGVLEKLRSLLPGDFFPAGVLALAGPRHRVANVEERQKWLLQIVDCVEPYGLRTRPQRERIDVRRERHRCVATNILEAVKRAHPGDERQSLSDDPKWLVYVSQRIEDRYVRIDG